MLLYLSVVGSYLLLSNTVLFNELLEASTIRVWC